MTLGTRPTIRKHTHRQSNTPLFTYLIPVGIEKILGDDNALGLSV